MGTGIAQGIGIAIAQGIGRIIDAGIDQIGKSISAADNLNESIIRTQKVFGEFSGEVLAWSQTTATAFGISEAAALKNASALGGMFVQMGVSREEAARMAKQLVESSADVAAFSDVSGGAAQVQEMFSAAFRGEYDSLQRVLPAMSDAAIVQQALADTGKENADQLTAQEKNLAAYNLIMQQATLMRGAFADAVERGAAAEEIFTARIADARAGLGQVGLIVQQELFRTLNELLNSMGLYGENIVEQLVRGMSQALKFFTPFFKEIRVLFDILRPGSPPPLLPELTEWGKAAMEEYLRGWTLADFDALRSLGSVIETIVRSFAGSGAIAETDLVSRIFGTQRTITQAVREFRQLGQVSEATLGRIADAAGPAGTEIAGLVREYFNLQRATKEVQAAQDELNAVTRKYDDALDPINRKLRDIRERRDDLTDQQRLEALGETLKDPRAEASERELARLEIEEIRLADHAQAIEEDRDTAVDAAQAKINAAQAEAEAQRERYSIFQQALEQQQQTNALIEEETTYRLRLANEILAAEERARSKLEAQRAKEQAELERINAAQLGYRLQLADTAGDLEIMLEELAKVTVGSAEYYQILTEIAQIEERLADERARAEGGGAGTIVESALGTPQERKQYLDEFRTDVRGALDALFGPADTEVKLSPFLQGVVGVVDNIKAAVENAMKIIPDFIALFTGEKTGSTSTADILRPTYNSGFLSQIYSAVVTTIQILRDIADGNWSKLWGDFREYVDNALAESPALKAIWTYITDTLIPLLEAVANDEWAKAWALFANPINALGDAAYIAGYNTMYQYWQGVKDWFGDQGNLAQEELRDLINKLLSSLGVPFIPIPDNYDFGDPLPGPPSGPGGGGGGGGGFGSFRGGFPGITPLVPALAGASSSMDSTSSPQMVDSNNTIIHIEQVIGANADLGGIRQATSAGIREGLEQQRLRG